MSKQGIRIAAEVFSAMQEARGRLLNMATQNKPANLTDIRLGQMLEDGKDAMKDTFAELTLEEKT